MRALAISLSLLIASLSFADTTMSEGVWFDGTQKSDTLKLTTEKTKIESRTVIVPSVCQRTEYRYQCRWLPGPCRTVCSGRRSCRRVCSPARQICRDFPVQVNYPCDRTVVQNYEVLDYYVNTTVTLDYKFPNSSAYAAEEFVATVTGKDLNLSVEDSGEYLLLKKLAGSASNRVDQLLDQSFNYEIQFQEARPIKEALDHGIKNVSLSKGILTFSLSKKFDTDNFIQRLKVYRARRLARNILLFDKNLSDTDMRVVIRDNSKVLAVDLNKLGIKLAKRTKIVLSTKYNPKGAEILNKDSFKLETTFSKVFKR